MTVRCFRFSFFLKFIINKFQIISGLSYVQNIPIVALVKLNLKKQQIVHFDTFNLLISRNKKQVTE